jgi:iron complex transport system substrate-binding protein
MLETVARALGKPGQGDALFASIQRRVAVASARMPASWRGQKVYFEVADAPYAAGEASFLGETLAQLGLGNVVPAGMGPFPKLNPEFVVRAQPAVMMATARAVADMPKRPGWSGIRALQQGQVCGFAQGQYETMVHPGPRQGETAEMIVECLLKLSAPAALPSRP